LKLENNRFLPHTAAQLTDHLIFWASDMIK
jgi:hypothetical protein